MFAMISHHTSELSSASLFLFGMTVGSWLILNPKQLIQYFSFDGADDWGQFIVQMIGQIILGVTIIPSLFSFFQWVYFS